MRIRKRCLYLQEDTALCQDLPFMGGVWAVSLTHSLCWRDALAQAISSTAGHRDSVTFDV